MANLLFNKRRVSQGLEGATRLTRGRTTGLKGSLNFSGDFLKIISDPRPVAILIFVSEGKATPRLEGAGRCRSTMMHRQ
jgi:hypothetical protein